LLAEPSMISIIIQNIVLLFSTGSSAPKYEIVCENSFYFILKMKLFSNFVLFSHAIETRKPNVILMITDDFGMGDFRIYNREAKVPTPNIDRLGHEGVNFYGATTASSRCSPSRYMLMTGRYSMEDQEGRTINKEQPHLAEMFKKAGYTTGLFGKQQPLPNGIKKENRIAGDWLKYNKRHQESWEFRQTVGRFSNEINVFQDFGYYEQTEKPQLYDFDYSFTKARLFFIFFFNFYRYLIINLFVATS
jgi:arylsulfatase A